jgi:hypothetical protein
VAHRVSHQNQAVLTRKTGYLTLRTIRAPAATARLQQEGYAVMRRVFSAAEVSALQDDVRRVFEEFPPDQRSPRYPPEHWEPFRYEMLNRSAPVQQAVGHPKILRAIEPLLGEDCHVIANTAWWQPPDNNEHGGRFWHIDSGPHVPRPAGVEWDARIPYPVFAVAAHLYLQDCPLESGPTGVIPGSHTSGQAPPPERMEDDYLEWEGRGAVPILAKAGDVALFVSDVWHRRLPTLPGDPGRMFVQCHYGRRDLAQRIRPTAAVNHLSEDAVARATSARLKTLAGLHRPGFDDG